MSAPSDSVASDATLAMTILPLASDAYRWVPSGEYRMPSNDALLSPGSNDCFTAPLARSTRVIAERVVPVRAAPGLLSGLSAPAAGRPATSTGRPAGVSDCPVEVITEP